MSSLREKLAAGEPQFGMAYSWPCAGIIEAAAEPFDFCWIDAQHGPWDTAALMNAVRACDLMGKPALVRVADHTYGRIGLALDMAPAGIILPCVETTEQAQAIVQAACFPPRGNRSFGGRRAIDRHGRTYAQDPKLQPLVIAQIETPRGLEYVESIAAVEGIDVLFFGPEDMKMRLGLSLDLPIRSPEVAPSGRAITEACRRHGKLAMTVSGTPADIEWSLKAGFVLINVAGDAGLIRRAVSETATMIAGIRKNIAK